MLHIKEKLRALANVPRFPRINAPRPDSSEAEGTDAEDGSGGDDEDEWSNIENLGSDEYDNREDYEDEWNNNVDMPSGLSDGEDDALSSLELNKPTAQVNGTRKGNEKVLVPVFPVG